MQFISLTEDNYHEGETWRFWLQVDGNEAEIAKLRARVAEQGDEGAYTLAADEDAIPESEVDILVKHSHSGYMAHENKVAGMLTLPNEDDLNDLLYKGRVAEHFTEPVPA